MTTVTKVTLTCDLCGNAKDVKTWTFTLDGTAYEIDLCRKDGDALGGVTAGYIAKARKVTAKPGQRQRDGGPRSRAASAASGRARTPRTKVSGAKARAARSTKAAKASHGQPRNEQDASTPVAGAAGLRQQKGVYVYGILPADIDVAAGVPGVGKHPGPLRGVHLDGLAALVSDVDLSGQLGSPDDLSTYREILDSTATEVPVLPLRFGTVLASEDAVAKELLAANRDEFTAALDRLEGRVQFQVTGRYVKDAGIEPGQPANDAVAARREQDTRALRQAMEGVAVASVAREPADELDSFHVAFLVAVDAEREVEQVIEDLAREWEGRIDVQLLGPMAAYDFTGKAQPES